jgi:exodeoxyribonuclease X
VKIRCIDTETTGVPSDEETGHALVEIGWCDLSEASTIDGTDYVVGEQAGELVNPGRPIPVQARAVHHISDEDVQDAIHPDEACMILNDGDHTHCCAHNIDFEKKFVGIGDRKWLCTYKTALRLWPDAPGHKLGELMYFLEIDKEPDFVKEKAFPAHRAPPDAYLCAFVLRKILRTHDDVEELIRWSNGPALLYMCFMKKHKNKPWATVAREDRPYLVWIYEQSDVKDRDIRATVKYWLNLTAQNT